MTDNRSRSDRSRSSFSRNGSSRAVEMKGPHATSRSRSNTRTPAPERRDEQILVELRGQGSIVNSSGRSTSQTRARSFTGYPNQRSIVNSSGRSRSQTRARSFKGSPSQGSIVNSSGRSRSQTRPHSFTRSPNQISGLKATQSRTEITRSISQTRLAENVSRGMQRSRSRTKSSFQSNNQTSAKEKKRQGRLSRGRMGRDQSYTWMVKSGSESSKSSERRLKSKSKIKNKNKNKNKKFDPNGRTAVITVKVPNDLTSGASKSSEDSLLKQRQSRTNKMRRLIVGRSKEDDLRRTGPKVQSGREVGENEEENSAEKTDGNNANVLSLSLEESREVPSVVEGVHRTISTLGSTGGDTNRDIVGKYNKMLFQAERERDCKWNREPELAEKVRKEFEERRHKELEEETKENSSIMGVLESNFYNGAYFLGEKVDILLLQAVKHIN